MRVCLWLMFLSLCFPLEPKAQIKGLGGNGTQKELLLGDQALSLEQWVEAEKHYWTALNKGLDLGLYANKVELLARIYESQGLWSELEAWTERILNLDQTKLPASNLAKLYSLHIQALLRQGLRGDKLSRFFVDYEEFTEWYFGPNSRERQQYELDLIELDFAKGNLELALDHTLKLKPKLQNKEQLSQAYHLLSQIYYAKNAIQQAEYYREKKLELLEQEQEQQINRSNLAWAYCGYIEDLLHTSKPYKALPFLEKALGLGSKLKGREWRLLQAQWAYQALRIFWHLGDTTQTLLWANRVLEQSLSSKIAQLEAKKLIEIIRPSQDQGKNWKRILEEKQKLEPKGSPKRYETYRLALYQAIKEGDWLSYERLIKAYRQESSSQGSETYHLALLEALADYEQNQWIEALAKLDTCLKQEDNLGLLCACFSLKAQIYQDLYQGSKDERYLIEAAKLLRQMGRYLEAAPSHQRSDFQIFDALNRDIEGLQKGLSLSAKLNNRLGKMAYQEDFYFWVELQNVLEWRDQIWRGSTQTNPYLPDSLANLEHQYFIRQGQRQDQSKLMGILSKQFPRYFDFKYTQEIEPLTELLKLIEPDVFLIQYAHQGGLRYTFSLYQGKVQLMEQVCSGDYFERLERFKNFTQGRLELSIEAYADLAYELYRDLLWELNIPVSAKRILIIPDAKLLGLSFDALLVDYPKTSDLTYRGLPYLIKRYQVGYAHSLGQYARNARFVCLPKPSKMLALGVQYRRYHPSAAWDFAQTLPEFKEARRQVDLLAGFIPGVFLRDTQAHEYAYRSNLEDCSLLHLKAQFQSNPYQPSGGGLLLAPFSPKDSADDLLEIAEIADLPLNLELVFLAGAALRIEDQALMARAFMFAGSPSVLFPLWSQDHEAGNFIVEHFYQNLKWGQTKDQALQGAKLRYLEKAREENCHPKYWAGFSHWGHARPTLIEDHIAWSFWLLFGSVLAGVIMGLFRWWIKEHESFQAIMRARDRLTSKMREKGFIPKKKDNPKKRRLFDKK